MNADELEKIIFSGLSQEKKEAIEEQTAKFKYALGLIARLRGPNGCPWDREQNHLTLRQYLIEEAYEVLDILDQYKSEKDPKALAKNTPVTELVPADGRFSKEETTHLKEELGDLLLQVLLHSELATERNEFGAGDVAQAMAEKLVSRHPHVFGSATAKNSTEVLKNWELLKKKEGKKKILVGLPKGLPSLQLAARIGDKVGRLGFDWKDWQGAMEKVDEELCELKEAIAEKPKSEIEHELGDLFFALCNLSRHLSLQPEDTHRKAIDRFKSRFTKLEETVEKSGKKIEEMTIEELEAVWQQVKKT